MIILLTNVNKLYALNYYYFNYNYFNEDKKSINNCKKLHNQIQEHHICSNRAH